MILQNYIKQYAKSFGEIGGDGPYNGMPANHPSVTDTNADAKTLRVGSAMSYRSWCNDTVTRMFKAGFDDLAMILKRKFLAVKALTDDKHMSRLHIGHGTFYRRLNKALLIFADVCPTFIFNQMYEKVSPVVNR